MLFTSSPRTLGCDWWTDYNTHTSSTPRSLLGCDWWTLAQVVDIKSPSEYLFFFFLPFSDCLFFFFVSFRPPPKRRDLYKSCRITSSANLSVNWPSQTFSHGSSPCVRFSSEPQRLIFFFPSFFFLLSERKKKKPPVQAFIPPVLKEG